MRPKRDHRQGRARGSRAATALWFGVALAITACASTPAPREAVAPAAPACDQREVGEASWYGPGLQGNLTASGEPFDQSALSAAHRSLPLPSLVRVTNLKNGRSVVVRVNDRGPFAQGRVMDLSRAAAQELSFIQAGETQVEACYLGPAPEVEG